jgi:hypothetical protein
MPGGTKIRTKNVARPVKEVKGGTRVSAGRISAHSKIGLEDRNEELKTHTRALPSLAPVAPQIEMPTAAKDTQQETKMGGEAATGEVSQGAGAEEIREPHEAHLVELHAHTGIVEHRLARQKSATTVHLGRIHDVMGRLMELTESHAFDAEGRLEAVEQRLAHLEMRYGTNRIGA